MDGITYKVKTADAEPFKTVIEKHGDVVEFTPIDMLNEQEQCKKVIKELKGKLEIETAKQANILEHHAWVKDLELQKLFTAHMYYESISFVEALPDKIKEFEAQLETSIEEYQKIAKELNLDILPKPIEVQIDKAMEKITGEPQDNGGGEA